MKPTLSLLSLCGTLLISACMQDHALESNVVSESSRQAAAQTSINLQALPLIAQEEVMTLNTVNDSVAVSQRNRAQKHKVLFHQSHKKELASSAVTINREKFAQINENNVKQTINEPLSTFSIDVDTGAYAVVRRYLRQGVLPPHDAVRVEELINYFDYQYSQPHSKNAPFTLSTEVAPTPWNKNTKLVQIGLQGYLPLNEKRKAANLVFLIDVSGSMNAADKLPLLKNAFKMLTSQLTDKDRISMVVYAGSSGVVLNPTMGDSKGEILSALNSLSAGGSTHGSSGIKLAYTLAEQAYIKNGINRIILATDGDFNVGTVSHEALIDLIEEKKKKGISLTTLGFGQGNYNDQLMEQLADHGDGNYAYIDSVKEARKVLVEQVSATLFTIAKDVKIQVEWNPSVVSEYRLVGYENRLLNKEDFNNDKVDAGEIGAGHSVTALYEITLTDSVVQRIDPLRYLAVSSGKKSSNNELGYIKLRYKKPNETSSKLIHHALTQKSIHSSITSASDSLQFAASVAAYGDLLRGGKHMGDFDYQQLLKLARTSRGKDKHGYRGEFIGLVELAETLSMTL